MAYKRRRSSRSRSSYGFKRRRILSSRGSRTSTAGRGLALLKASIKEPHWFDNSINETPYSAGSVVVDLGEIAKGDTADDREGNAVVVRAIDAYLKVSMERASGTNNQGTYLKAALVRSKGTRAAPDPASLDGITFFARWPYGATHQVIWQRDFHFEKAYTSADNVTETRTFRIFKKIMSRVFYGEINNEPICGGYYLILWSNCAQAQASVVGRVTLTFSP